MSSSSAPHAASFCPSLPSLSILFDCCVVDFSLSAAPPLIVPLGCATVSHHHTPLIICCSCLLTLVHPGWLSSLTTPPHPVCDFVRDILIHYLLLSSMICISQNAEHALNLITLQRHCSVFSVLQLGYEPKQNGEQNTEHMRRMLNNWDPKGGEEKRNVHCQQSQNVQSPLMENVKIQVQMVW